MQYIFGAETSGLYSRTVLKASGLNRETLLYFNF